MKQKMHAVLEETPLVVFFLNSWLCDDVKLSYSLRKVSKTIFVRVQMLCSPVWARRNLDTFLKNSNAFLAITALFMQLAQCVGDVCVVVYLSCILFVTQSTGWEVGG